MGPYSQYGYALPCEGGHGSSQIAQTMLPFGDRVHASGSNKLYLAGRSKQATALHLRPQELKPNLAVLPCMQTAQTVVWPSSNHTCMCGNRHNITQGDCPDNAGFWRSCACKRLTNNSSRPPSTGHGTSDVANLAVAVGAECDVLQRHVRHSQHQALIMCTVRGSIDPCQNQAGFGFGLLQCRRTR